MLLNTSQQMQASSMNLEPLDALSVLLVEDTQSERLFIAKLLKEMGLKVSSCASGSEALAIYRQELPDIVISDWRMPAMTGPELCHHLKQEAIPPYTLLLTANNQAKHMIEGIESGADDFLTKPFIPSILKVRLLAAARIVKMQQYLAQQNTALNSALSKEQAYLAQVQDDLDSAAKLQGSMLPSASNQINDWRLAARFQPAQELAGDIFQCFSIDDSHLGFYLLDVTGHGIAASMQSFTLAQRLSCKSCNWDSLDPALIVNELNADFDDPENAGRFATLILGIANTDSGQVRLTIAGHPQPILIDNHGAELMALESGIPLGIDNHFQYSYNSFFLNSQQHLMLYSDGVYECHHPEFGEFGQHRLLKACSDAHQLLPESLLHHLSHAVDLWQEKSAQDDISMMILSTSSLKRDEEMINQETLTLESSDKVETLQETEAIGEMSPPYTKAIPSHNLYHLKAGA
ncbi:PP2C family protein-serine/threonine phosphatase [Shewanella sp. UCD-KL12]|uniref:PP2C family protein-serine/threonine phosphatase n=1 Tax=Shewanella sp. UCD-KL12 TaxID=1917163 RepID=UPI00211634C1|nr:fused response regulator/phosphatase [Shewanella sp. UCD-KL12]